MDALNSFAKLSYLATKPAVEARFKQLPEHFQVIEVAELPPSTGEGEHQWLWVEKSGANTQFVADKLAEWAGVSSKWVSFSGLKDRQALTQQWFSVQLPGRELLPWQDLVHPEFRVLQAQLQPRKLKRGFHHANHFKILLTDISQPDQFEVNWQRVIGQGVPNYFGLQRFGRDGHNLTAASAWLRGQGRRPKRPQQSLYLSALRSFIFNEVVSARIKAKRLAPEIGDRMQLAGSQSFFVVDEVDDTILQRWQSGDVRVTASLTDGELLQDSPETEFVEPLYQAEPDIFNGLRKQRVSRHWRPMLLTPAAAHYEWRGDDAVEVQFQLPSGSFATAVLRELVNLID
ncbi:tRNA pseudouridine(13) synthase TruD [Pseudidiomarina taiwanensis]|uniref:tRNA pseudouridine synthase D n=1 Tax=Pseudidiomarina taiwanensis TaxID=337250 RepID=A0A432ZNI9_9GAMM|nr:tRNA pseudouridine(13) synthase TruD [Pseudidiomarina taiwanensis]RUO79450.1 tRNA pseudouridine(13) synthase TruD [Pseudidiomarina taiwanensis]